MVDRGVVKGEVVQEARFPPENEAHAQDFDPPGLPIA